MVAQTYAEYSRNFDEVHRALHGGLGLQYAIDHGYIKSPYPAHGQYMPEHEHINPENNPQLTPHLKPHWLNPKPHPHFVNQFDIYRFGDQFGRQFDPSHYGWVHGKPNQGYGNWLAGKPRLPEPEWPRLTPNSPRFKPY